MRRWRKGAHTTKSGHENDALPHPQLIPASVASKWVPMAFPSPEGAKPRRGLRGPSKLYLGPGVKASEEHDMAWLNSMGVGVARSESAPTIRPPPTDAGSFRNQEPLKHQRPSSVMPERPPVPPMMRAAAVPDVEQTYTRSPTNPRGPPPRTEADIVLSRPVDLTAASSTSLTTSPSSVLEGHEWSPTVPDESERLSSLAEPKFRDFKEGRAAFYMARSDEIERSLSPSAPRIYDGAARTSGRADVYRSPSFSNRKFFSSGNFPGQVRSSIRSA